MANDKTQIWYLISSLNVGGAQRTLVDLVNNIDRDEFEPVIWTLMDPGPLASDVDEDIPVKSLRIQEKYEINKIIKFIKEIRSESPDILQSYLYFDNITARIVGLASQNTTIICGVRSMPDNPSLSREILDRLTISAADAHISNSEAGVNFIVNRGAPRKSVYVVYNGRDLAKYRDATVTSELRELLGIPSDAVIVGTVGRLTKRKGHYDLINAWTDITCSSSDCYLIIAGGGPEMDGLKECAKKNGVDKTVHLIGERDDIPELLDLFDIFVFPSHYEGLPGALLEAMAAEKPIITTPVDGNSELIRDGKEGTHVPPKDTDELANVLEEYINNPKAYREIAINARRRAFDKFTIKQMVSKHISIYKSIIPNEK